VLCLILTVYISLTQPKKQPKMQAAGTAVA